MTLNEVSPMKSCVVTKISAPGLLGQRLCDLGLCPGTHIRFVRKAPLCDPIHVQVSGYHVALRRTEAHQIEVETIND